MTLLEITTGGDVTQPTTAEKAQLILDEIAALEGDLLDDFVEHMYGFFLPNTDPEKPSLLGGDQVLSVPLLVFPDEEWTEIDKISKEVPTHVYHPYLRGVVLVSRSTYESMTEQYSVAEIERAFTLHDFAIPRISVELVEHQIHPFWFALEQAHRSVKDEHELPESTPTPEPKKDDGTRWT